MKKSIQYVVTHVIPEVFPFFLNVAIEIPIALSVLQLIVIDLGFELFAALSYAWEPAESPTGLMKTPPRRPVTHDSIIRLRATEARKHKLLIESGKVHPETGEIIERSRGRKILHSLTRPFTVRFWGSFFEKPEGEILVDSSLLSWAFLEVGVIELIGCLTSFFVVLYYGKNPNGGAIFAISPWDSIQINKIGGFAPNNKINYTTSRGNVLVETIFFNSKSIFQNRVKPIPLRLFVKLNRFFISE